MRYSHRLQTLLVPTMPLPLAVVAAIAVVRGGPILLVVLALAAASLGVIALSMRPQDMFVAWLAVAPFVQTTITDSRLGHVMRIVVYSAPPLLFAFWTLVRR